MDIQKHDGMDLILFADNSPWLKKLTQIAHSLQLQYTLYLPLTNKLSVKAKGFRQSLNALALLRECSHELPPISMGSFTNGDGIFQEN